MSDLTLSTEIPAVRPRGPRGRAARRAAAMLALAVLAGCEHGQLSFDQSSGQFRLPVGGGSREPGTNR